MIAPQEWYDYQKQYQKYGLDMKPQSERVPVRRRRKEAKKTSLLSDIVSIPKTGDRKLVMTVLLIGILVILMLVVTSSYAAKLTYDINRLQVENDALIGEIEDLDVKMMSSNSISYIEETARTEMGMKSAGADNCVFISAEDTPEEGFADILKQKAFN